MTIREIGQFVEDLKTINMASAQDGNADPITRVIARAKLELILAFSSNLAALAATQDNSAKEQAATGSPSAQEQPKPSGPYPVPNPDSNS